MIVVKLIDQTMIPKLITAELIKIIPREHYKANKRCISDERQFIDLKIPRRS